MKQINLVASKAEKILKEHNLCDSCLGRLFSSNFTISSNKKLGKEIRFFLNKKSPKICFICKNLMENIDFQVSKLFKISQAYEFSTFLVGAILQPSIMDRDDQVRSKFKLKGVDGIKGELNRQIGKKFGRKTGTTVDYRHPDILFTLNFKKDEFGIKSKPVCIYGRYTKEERGVPQKQGDCKICKGNGCFECQFHGISGYDSVEGKIAKFAFEKFGARQAKFTWVGGEDDTSLVLGKGRPFFAKLIDPFKRNPILNKKISLGGIEIHGLKVINQIPKVLKFRSDILLRVEAEDDLNYLNLKNLRDLEKQPIFVYDNSGKKSKKEISNVKYKKESQKTFFMKIKSDGGVPMKRFASGEDVTPNLTSILQSPCKCISFDFYDITLAR